MNRAHIPPRPERPPVFGPAPQPRQAGPQRAGLPAPAPAAPRIPEPPKVWAAEPGRPLAGHTKVATQALVATAQAIGSEVLGVPVSQVRAVLNDEFGQLALSLSLPLPVEVPGPGLPNVWERARAARSSVGERFVEATGSAVRRVDIRVNGILPAGRGRA